MPILLYLLLKNVHCHFRTWAVMALHNIRDFVILRIFCPFLKKIMSIQDIGILTCSLFYLLSIYGLLRILRRTRKQSGFPFTFPTVSLSCGKGNKVAKAIKLRLFCCLKRQLGAWIRDRSLAFSRIFARKRRPYSASIPTSLYAYFIFLNILKM